MRKAGLIALAIGALGSVALMLYSARASSQHVLQVLFAIWVLSPFLLLELGDIVSRRWPVITRALYWLMLVIASGSLAVYGVAVLRSPGSIPTPVFVATPPISWLVIAVIGGMASWRTHGRV